MPFTLTMPKLSPTMEIGTLVKWHKKVGDFVRCGDVLFEVATDKATVEHSALDEGYLRRIIVEEGSEARINQPVAIFTETAGESIEGYYIEPIVLVQEPKPQEEIAPKTQPASQQPVKEWKQPVFSPEQPLTKYVFQSPQEGPHILASPLARKLAKERGIDLTTVRGTGPRQRIVSNDLNLGQPKALVSFDHNMPPEIAPGSYIEETLTPMRKVIAQRLQESKTFIPHFYISQEIAVDNLVKTRAELKTGGVALSVNDFIIRAVALALRQHPEVNSGFHSGNNTIVRYQTIDIAIAVSIPAGLITPIIRHADYKNLGALSAEMRYLAQKAKTGKLERQEYVGGSFTISNLGMYGIDSFIGVINPPHAAILSIGAIIEKPVIQEGAIAVGKCMQLTLSADHRVIDGSNGAKFIKTVQKFLENPSLLIV